MCKLDNETLTNYILKDGKPINSAVAETALEIMRNSTVNALNPENNATFFGHEINQMFNFGRLLIQNLEQNLNQTEVANFLDRVYEIYSQLLGLSELWQELSPVRGKYQIMRDVLGLIISSSSLLNVFIGFCC